VEAAGIEPASDFAVTRDLACSCIVCEECRAANALQNGGSNCHFLASADADLQRVVGVWDGLPGAMRKAILALVGSIEPAVDAG
jgi:hypothetical protein